MIFKNKHAYFVKNNTNNNTNTKNFELLNNDFIIEATFKFEEDTNLIQREYCVVGRVGYTMGIFVDSYKNIKWEWWETNDDGEQLYRDIYVTNVDVFNYNTIKVIKEKKCLNQLV